MMASEVRSLILHSDFGWRIWIHYW